MSDVSIHADFNDLASMVGIQEDEGIYLLIRKQFSHVLSVEHNEVIPEVNRLIKWCERNSVMLNPIRSFHPLGPYNRVKVAVVKVIDRNRDGENVLYEPVEHIRKAVASVVCAEDAIIILHANRFMDWAEINHDLF